jgi:hypothetical protein
MEAFSSFFDLMSGTPAIVGLFAAALILFLTSDWRLSLAALLAQYLLVGLALARFIEPEVAVVKILVGVLVVPILYLGVRHNEGSNHSKETDEGSQFLGMSVGWDSGPLGLPLRLMAVLLVFLGLVRLLGQLRPPILSANLAIELALVAIWMGGMGLIGLVLGGGPLRAATSILTILAGFDLVYAILEPSLAIVGFYGALTLLTGLAFSYLAAVKALGFGEDKSDREGTLL